MATARSYSCEEASSILQLFEPFECRVPRVKVVVDVAVRTGHLPAEIQQVLGVLQDHIRTAADARGPDEKDDAARDGR